MGQLLFAVIVGSGVLDGPSAVISLWAGYLTR